MHKNKTLVTFIAATLGGSGIHRFYLYGIKDIWAWCYASFILVYITYMAYLISTDQIAQSVLAWFPISMLVAFVEALVIGLTADDKWDAKHNASSLVHSESSWPHVILLVLTLATGFVFLVACLSRATDLIYTGGSYG